MKNLLRILLVSILFPLIATSQKIDNSSAFRDMKSDNYFRIHYDNDFFTATDIYYTQGYSLELASKFFRRNPLNATFFKLNNSDKIYGIAIEHVGYAPTSIKSDSILYGDRPFAAAIMLKSFLISTDTLNKIRVSSGLNLGIIGPGAFGKEMQTSIHEWIGDEIPHGWQHQIKNDIVINYELAHEKQLYRFRNLFYLNSNAKLRVGTMNTNASAGITAAFGIVNSPFTSIQNKSRFKIYAYFQPMGSIIGYDATLQGGIFNRKSPYTISNSDISRFTLQQNYGIVMQFRRLYFEYLRSELTREFRNSRYHKWGGIRIGIDF